MPIGLPADADQLRGHSTWFIVYGVVMALFGLFAIALPGIATLAVSLTIGWLLLLGGAVGLVAVIKSGRSAPGFWWNLITAIVFPASSRSPSSSPHICWRAASATS
jgi:uncharacterized membrane protein HdeD (DUF308 family)